MLDDSAIMAPNLPQFFHEIIDSIGKIFTDWIIKNGWLSALMFYSDWIVLKLWIVFL